MDSSLDSSEEENGKQEEEKKREIGHAKESSKNQKAMDTMNNVNGSADKSDYLLRQVQEIKKKAMFSLHIYSSRAVLSYLTGLFKVRLTHFNFEPVFIGAHSHAKPF